MYKYDKPTDINSVLDTTKFALDYYPNLAPSIIGGFLGDMVCSAGMTRADLKNSKKDLAILLKKMVDTRGDIPSRRDSYYMKNSPNLALANFVNGDNWSNWSNYLGWFGDFVVGKDKKVSPSLFLDAALGIHKNLRVKNDGLSYLDKIHNLGVMGGAIAIATHLVSRDGGNLDFLSRTFPAIDDVVCALDCACNTKNYPGALSDIRSFYDSLIKNFL